MNMLPLIDSEGIHGTPVNQQYEVGDLLPNTPSIGYLQVSNTNWPYCSCWHTTKSAREQVQDEILTKMAEAIEANDLKKAKQLVQLAKALKEL